MKGRKRHPCTVCGGLAPRPVGYRVCTPCRVAKKEARTRKHYEATGRAKSTPEELKQREAARAEARKKKVAGYKAQGLTYHGLPFKTGWVSGLTGLTPLESNPILDPDYEFGCEDRLSEEELKWLL